MRIGTGYDSHRLVTGRKLVIGGVEIPSTKGSLGHSDGDVLCHAVIDSIIGALGMGDIGGHFPDTDDRWKDASSIDLLSRTVEMAGKHGFCVLWVDTTVILEEPKLRPFIREMKQNISKAGIPPDSMNIKTKTNEGMDSTGRGEALAAYAVCLLEPLNTRP